MLRALAVFRVCCRRYCEYSQYFEVLDHCRYYSTDTFGLALVRDSLLLLRWLLPVVLQVSPGFVLRVLQVLGISISSVGSFRLYCEYAHSTEITLNMPSINGVWRILRRSAHRVDNSQAHCSARNNRRWSHEVELEQIAFAGDNSSTWSTQAVF